MGGLLPKALSPLRQGLSRKVNEWAGVYILDEITAVLDSGSRWYLMEFLRQEVLRGCLVVLSTNIATETQGFATQVVVLEKGQVQLNCETSQLDQHFQKWLVPRDQESIFKAHPQLRRVSLSGDYWICLGRRGEALDAIQGLEKDQREITIADVQTFFTAGENRP